MSCVLDRISSIYEIKKTSLLKFILILIVSSLFLSLKADPLLPLYVGLVGQYGICMFCVICGANRTDLVLHVFLKNARARK